MSYVDVMPVPERVAASIDQLCIRVRQGRTPVYGTLLRENVLEAIGCSFPLFCECLQAEKREHLASTFMAMHAAQLPQFHHAATEFVRFAQSREDIPRHLLCLLEYEWALLAAEIDSSNVPAAPASDALIADGTRFAANPTLCVVTLPFDIRNADTQDIEAEQETTCVYAIYRTSQHHILTRELDRWDCLALDGIERCGRVVPSMLQPFPEGQSVERFTDWWLRGALESNLVHINEKSSRGAPT